MELAAGLVAFAGGDMGCIDREEEIEWRSPTALTRLLQTEALVMAIVDMGHSVHGESRGKCLPLGHGI